MSKIKLTLLSNTENPVEVIAMAGKLCYSKSNIEDILEKMTSEQTEAFVNRLVSYGHESPLEHVSFTFAVEGISRACYDNKTEVLTSKGWKYFKDLDDDEIVATFNKETENVEFHKINEKIQYKYKGKLDKYESQNVDLVVTPNHKMLIKKHDVRTPQKWNLVSSENIKINRFKMTKQFNYKKETSNTITIEGYEYDRKNNNGGFYKKKIESRTFDKELFLRFFAWYLSDGYTTYEDSENKYVINISQTKCKKNIENETIEEIMEIITELGFNPHYDKDTICFTSPLLGNFLRKLGKSHEKYIPINIFEEFDKHYAKIFIDTYFKGDGHLEANGCGKLYTTSKLLVDQLMTLTFMAGYTSYMWTDNRQGNHYINGHKIRRNHICYVLNVTTKNKRNINPMIKIDQHKTQIDYDDYVYCVNVPNHTLFVRRNGKAIWCGNCSHQIVRHRIASYSQQSQRYVDLKETFDYVTPKILFDMDKHYSDMGYVQDFQEDMETIHDMYTKWQRRIEEFVKETNYPTYGMTPSKVANENARAVLPNACETKLVFTMNLRTLIHFIKHRKCRRAQEEIRELAILMEQVITEKYPIFSNILGAPCQLGKCPEGNMTCKMPYEKIKK